MTSLAKQLAAIAATSTHQLDLKAQKAAHGKSLLFEPRQASSQDFNSIYQICHEGFQELCSLDSRFSAFETNLFSEQSKSEDRTQMTKQENEELDVVIERFLDLLSGRLLLRPAVKAVEWLIRRFRIHEYNTELTLFTFLPYHATPLLPTLLSILPPKLPPIFRFLFPYVTNLTSPPYRVIVYTATNTPAFFTAFGQYVLRLAKTGSHSSHTMSFWVGVATQAVDGMLDTALSGRTNIQAQKTEDALLRIDPILDQGLAVSSAPELTMGCYMIAIVLAKKGHLDDNVLDNLMERVVRTLRFGSRESALLCLAAIAQERQALRLPKSVVKRLLKEEDLTTQLKRLSNKSNMDRLALGIILSILKRKNDRRSSTSNVNDVDVAWEILQAQILGASRFSFLVKNLLGSAHIDGNHTSDTNDKAVELLRRLSNSHVLGSGFRKVIEDEGTDVEQLELKLLN